NNLIVELPRIEKRAAAERDLKEQLEGYERDGQINDARAILAQMLACQIEITTEAAIGSTQTTINAPVLKRAEDSVSQSSLRKEREHGAVIGICRQCATCLG